MKARAHIKWLLGAMKEATAWIKSDKKAAAEAYLRVTKDKMPVEEMVAILNDPSMVITIQPNVITRDERMGLQFGETVVVHKNGCETLNDFPRQWVTCEA